MSLIGLLASTEKMVPEGRLHMRPFQFHLKEHWRYPQSLDILLSSSETFSAHLECWQSPANMMKGADLHPKDHSIQIFTDASNKGWGAHLEQVRKATQKCSRVEGVFSGSSRFNDQYQNQTVLVAMDNSSNLHKQTRRNPLSGDVRSPVENHDLVPSISDNRKNQRHSRVSECDDQPSIQVKTSPVNKMVTAGVQTVLSSGSLLM